ncbi:MAG: hypothetical protein JO198_03025 [Candidatus Dormibacteraeota bacterium]|nr:hypothetical protein [Candidatus Dormibacteraeota bacterium]
MNGHTGQRILSADFDHLSPLPPDLYDPKTGRFDREKLRLELIIRGVTPETFASKTGVPRTSVYKALRGESVRDRTAINILFGLASLPPRLPLTPSVGR